MTGAVVWRGAKAFVVCADCRKIVRINKPVFGDIHLCLTPCERAGTHLDVQVRRAGPFWRRRDERFCRRCGVML